MADIIHRAKSRCVKRLRSLDEAIVALWASGTRSQGEIGRQVGLDQRSVSRRITRMVRRGAWPFHDRPDPRAQPGARRGDLRRGADRTGAIPPPTAGRAAGSPLSVASA